MNRRTSRRQWLEKAALAATGLWVAGRSATAADDAPKAPKKKNMKLRPHHLLDIISAHGHGREFKPSPYGHAVHLVAAEVLANVETKVKFIVGADDICQPCKHLLPNGQCDDMVRSVSPPISKQKYNDDLDRRLFRYLDVKPGTVMTVREFLTLVGKKLPGIEKLCTHPREDQKQRLKGLIEGSRKRGIRKDADAPSARKKTR